MDCRPLKRYRRPAYPTRLDVLADPTVLARHVPDRWKRNTVTATTLSLFLAANSCVRSDGNGQQPQTRAAIVAPIFEHGDGRGAAGCVVVSPPVFLSEEEALQVITEELTAAGMKITGTNVVLSRVAIPQRREYYREVGSAWGPAVEEIPGKAAPLTVDITDDKRRAAVEFVSHSDYFRLGGPQSGSTVQDYDFREVAAGVAKAVEKNGTGIYFGTFYDPMITADERQFAEGEDWETRWKKARAEAGAESKRLLRQQVKDFVDWLQGQGAI